MLDAHAQAFPEAVQVFNFFYGVDAPGFLINDDKNVASVWSTEGPRQGCSAGTYLFCTGVVSLLSKLQSLFPEFSLLALTDDINALVPPPEQDTPEEWQKRYKRYAEFLAALKDLSKNYAGLQLNATKCGLLLPPGAPAPSDEIKALFPPGFDFVCVCVCFVFFS
jgi:hypothetical protein